MLIFTHKPGDWVHIRLRDGVSPRTPLGALFSAGCIRIMVVPISADRARLAIDVPEELEIQVDAGKRR